MRTILASIERDEVDMAVSHERSMRTALNAIMRATIKANELGINGVCVEDVRWSLKHNESRLVELVLIDCIATPKISKE